MEECLYSFYICVMLVHLIKLCFSVFAVCCALSCSWLRCVLRSLLWQLSVLDHFPSAFRARKHCIHHQLDLESSPLSSLNPKELWSLSLLFLWLHSTWFSGPFLLLKFHHLFFFPSCVRHISSSYVLTSSLLERRLQETLISSCFPWQLDDKDNYTFLFFYRAESLSAEVSRFHLASHRSVVNLLEHFYISEL